MTKFWQTSKRTIDFSRGTLVMGILNVTPDSFSDGGKYVSIDDAVMHAERLIEDGADIIDIGGESTRPCSERISIEEEINRVIPVIKAITKRFDAPISVDTSKSEVAEIAIQHGAEIINDISGLKFDERIGVIAAKHKTGLVLMHLRGSFEEMHKHNPVENILDEVSIGFAQSIEKAKGFGIEEEQICLDVGIGFSKTFEQNLELIAKLGELVNEFPRFPMLIGTSRKSFIGKVLGQELPENRLIGSIASNAIASWNGANIVRVHDVQETVEALKVVQAIKREL
jgi:dihydropteroate synthase